MPESPASACDQSHVGPEAEDARDNGFETGPLQEFVDSGGVEVSVDATTGLVGGVKLLGLRSRNGRTYTESALRSAVGLYEGAKVNVNHPAGDPRSARDYRDRVGVVRNIRMKAGEGLFGDLHCNPKHPIAEQLIWDAEHSPGNVGLSHNVVARTRRRGAELVVEAITRVQSVDLVADPATTSGLFEHAAVDGSQRDAADSSRDEVAQLREWVDRLEAQLRQARREAVVGSLLQRHGLTVEAETSGEPLVSQSFLEQLFAVEDDAAIERLIEDRVRLVRAAECRRGADPPTSRERADPESGDHGRVASAAAFVEAITRRTPPRGGNR